ncbi:hypothetical protein FRC09_000408 [Ceratobasidium sp. 395]|nr:hypothetical protein FRC09_000408 [Ceratobasidium sp. 395]
MIKRIKRRIHRAEEKLDRLFGGHDPTIPSTQTLTTSNPAPLVTDGLAQRLPDPAPLQLGPSDDVLRQDFSPIPARAVDQEPSALFPNIEPIQAEHQSGQNSTALPAQAQTGINPVPLLEVNTSKHQTAWSGLRTLLSVLDNSPDAFGPLKSAVGGLLSCLESYEDQVAAQEEYQQLKIDLESVSLEIAGYVGGAAPPSMESSILKLSQGIEDELRFINRKTQRHALNRYSKAEVDADEILTRYRRVQKNLDAFALSAGMKIWQIVDDQATRSRLKELPNSPVAKYCSTEATESSDLGRNGCTPNTRVKVLEQLRDWAQDSHSRKVYWLNGMAGTGKTTIAYSLCLELEYTGQLAASFFCSRQLPSCRRVGLILPSIAYQLALFLRPFRYELSRVLERDPDAHNQPIGKQFQILVAGPLRQIKSQLRGDLVIVIDALDECENSDSVSKMLSALLEDASGLPIKLFLTSRPEPKILKRMESKQGERVRLELRLHELERSVVQSDIETYLATELNELSLEPQTLAQLVERSGVLFIYAATVVRYISHNDMAWSKKRIQLVTSTSSSSNHSHQRLDELYGTILDLALTDKRLEQDERDAIAQVLHTVICAQEPLTIEAIAGLLGFTQVESVLEALRLLSSVLQVSNTTGLVTTLHESFPDYLLDAKRSGQFFCDAGKQHLRLALTCFGLVKTPSSPFNICGLGSSYVLDAEVPYLDKRVRSSISQHLFYACLYWEIHVECAEGTGKLMDQVFEFLSTRLLLWMEILNLKHKIHTGAGILSKLHQWISSGRGRSEIRDLCHDACRFVNLFAFGTMSQLTPHIYVSALALWPPNRPVSRYRSNRFHSLAQASGAALDRQDEALLATLSAPDAVFYVTYSPDGATIVSGSFRGIVHFRDAHTGKMIGQSLDSRSGGMINAAYSPDGKHIASTSANSTISIWDVRTGQMVGQPLQGHTHEVNSVAYSPNGLYLASGSEDKTVRIWDPQAGQALGQPLEGYTQAITSVSYSHDSAYIASSSADCSIRIWDVQSGAMRGQPLIGHGDSIWSVAFSPDGLSVVSGSKDGTIRIWDAHTGEMRGQQLEGHRGGVWSVVYSPDGARIVSGSADQTLCIWDVGTGQMLGQPLRGHTSDILSVAFSPDGSRIASGSWDETIRIWDAHIGQSLGQPPEGHTGTVNSVAYSPDGTRIASGSEDNTLCIWDAYTGRMVGQPLKGHTANVNSVVYSLDGTFMVSGSGDRTIRIWDTSSGQMVGQPLKGHLEPVLSVALSLDSSRIASGSNDHTVCIWDSRTGQMVRQPLEGHTNRVFSVAFSPDGARIVSGSADQTICIWDANTGEMVGQPLKGHNSWVQSVAYSPSGTHIVSGSDDSTICIWDARTGHMVGQPLEGHTGYVWSVAYSPDGARIVSGSNDMTIRIWDAHSGHMLGQPLEGHTKVISSVAYSPDGKHVVSGSWDNSIRIWDVCALSNSGKTSSDDLNLLRQSPPASDLLDPISGDFDHASRVYEPRTQRGFPIHSNFSDLNAWTLSMDGWVVGHNLKPLLWVPPHLRDTLLRYGNERLISTEGSWSLDISKAKFGKDWHQCYRP